MEIWKDISGYESLYQISSFGRVRSLDRFVEMRSKYGKSYQVRKLGRILKLKVDSDGYHSVMLYGNNARKTFHVHRLVASAFIDNPENKPQVNHIDRNRTNNCVENLEWCTSFENMQHAVRCGAKLGGNLGKHLSDETKRKISEKHIGKKIPQHIKDKISNTVRLKRDIIVKHNIRRVEVYCVELDKYFESMAEASRYFSVSETAIYNSIRYNYKLMKSFTLVKSL